MVIPGWVEGRSVKWLEEITVSAAPSDNYYHKHDLRILPSDIDAKRATKEGAPPSTHTRPDTFTPL
eukprot:591380-Pyramimonas_sp.AAC.1